MPDQKPPRLAVDERDTLLALLQYQRDSFCRKLDGISEDAARQQIVASGTTLLWLAKHLRRAEALWVQTRFAGEADAFSDDEVSADDTVAGAVADYRETSQAVDAVIRSHELSAEAPPDGDLPPVNLRWIVMHLLEETARHAGHADLLRELLDGQVGR